MGEREGRKDEGKNMSEIVRKRKGLKYKEGGRGEGRKKGGR